MKITLFILSLAFLFPSVIHAETFFPATLVYSGNRGGTISLASTTGAVKSMVVLRVVDTSGSNSNIGLRTTGAGGTFTPASTHVGGSNALMVGGRSLYLTGVTNSSGQIDLVSTGSGGVDIYLEAYTVEGSASASPPMDLYFGFIIFLLITFFLVWLFRTKPKRD